MTAKTVTFHKNYTVKIGNRTYSNLTSASVVRLMKCYHNCEDHGTGGPNGATRYFNWKKGFDFILFP